MDVKNVRYQTHNSQKIKSGLCIVSVKIVLIKNMMQIQ